MKHELAPAALIRAAAWPIETLDAFGALELLDCRASSPSFAAGYEAAINRERAALWARTAGHSRFMKALLLASPSLFERVRRTEACRRARGRSVRQLEAALYRYLARASARAVPAGLWAGVTVAPFGEVDLIRPAAGHADFTPDLVPFAAVLRSLAKRTEYRGAGSWRLAPTLRRSDDGHWVFLTRATDASVDVRQLRADRGAESLLTRLEAAGRGTLAEISSRTRLPRELVDRLAEGGVLIGGLSLAPRFASPWEALATASDDLRHAERAQWNRARSAIKEIAGNLSLDFDGLTAADVAVRVAQAHNVVAELIAGLHVDFAVPPAALHCDLRLPFDVSLGPAMRRHLLASLDAYQSEWIDDISPRSHARREWRRALRESLARAPLPLGGVLPEVSSCAGASSQAWAATFRGPASEVRSGPRASGNPEFHAPWGCLLARLGDGGIARVLGLDDSPVRPWSRHSRLLGEGNPLEHWLRECEAGLEGSHGVRVGDLAVPFECNPNVLERPLAGRSAVEPWAAGGIDLRGAELRTESGAIVLHVPSMGRMTILSCSVARLASGDPVAELIAASGFGESAQSARATSAPGPDEHETLSYAPRLLLSSGAAIRPRRTALTGIVLKELTRLPRHERYLRWLGLVRGLGWPERVAVSVDGGPSLMCAASSPLAIEAAFAGAQRATRIVVEEAETQGWLKGPDGTHVAEILMPFSRSPHAFSNLAAR